MIPCAILVIEDDDDREFMSALYMQYHTLLYTEILKIVKNQWIAEDILQNVVVKLIDKIMLLRQLNQRGLVNYMITAAKHTALNYFRDEKFVSSLDEQYKSGSNSTPLPEDVIIHNEDLRSLSNVWEYLDEKTQYLLQAKYILGKSLKEIAEEINIPPDNVRMAVVRAKRKAKRAIEERECAKK